jgi:flagellar biosynthesis GTPase FlhF
MIKLSNVTKISILFFSVMAMALVVPAYAKQTSAEAETPTGQSNLQEQARQAAEKKQEEVKKLAEQKKAEIKAAADQKREEAQKAAKASLEQKKSEVKAKTEDQRKKACDAVTGSLNNRLSGGVNRSGSLKGGFDKHLSNIQAFYAKKNLSVANYDVLLANAQAAGIQAQASINALKTFSPTVNCSDVGAAAGNIAGYKEALSKVRADLNSYRNSIKALLTAVRHAAETTKTEGKNNE